MEGERLRESDLCAAPACMLKRLGMAWYPQAIPITISIWLTPCAVLGVCARPSWGSCARALRCGVSGWVCLSCCVRVWCSCSVDGSPALRRRGCRGGGGLEPDSQLPRSREVPGLRCHRLLREHRGPHALLSTPRNIRGLLQPIISVRLLRFSVRLISNFSPAIDHVRQLFIWSSRTDF